MTKPRAAVIQCVDLLFQFESILSKHNVSIVELDIAFQLAIESGHERLELALSMASIALEDTMKARIVREEHNA